MKEKTIDDLIPGKDHYLDMFDLFGTEDPTWSPKKVKELLKEMIKSGIIYHWTEARLYRFLLTRGVLNLENRHKDFFRNLIRASRTSGGKALIEKYTQSEEKIPPDISVFGKQESTESSVEEVEVKEVSTLNLAQILEKLDPLETKHIESVKQILKDTEFLESINVDEEAMQFYVNYEISELWKKAFENPKNTVNILLKEGKSGNKYRDLVAGKFLYEYNEAKKLKIPKEILNYYDPFLMQRYVAYKVKSLPNFGNFSGTGAGKTLSAILASKIIDSKMTLIICPNDVVDHWKNNIEELFPHDKILIKKDVFAAKYDNSRNQFLILNWDSIQQKHLVKQMMEFVKQQIDFVVLDEIHFSKITLEKAVSERRKNLEGILSKIRKKNKLAKTLGLSATPVVNNLYEGKSLLELMSGIFYDDVKTKPTVPNAVILYEKMTNLSIRHMPNYKISVNRHYQEVEAKKPDGVSLALLNRYPLAIEQFLTDARIPEIIKRINGPTIIYSEYVGSSFPKQQPIIEKIADAVDDAGFSYGFYTGQNHSGLQQFKDKKIQVLIASRPISTGIDGLQTVCTNLIFNTLPWTHALYQQIIGRIVRTGQGKKVVDIHHIKGTIGGYPYDQTKLDRLKFKRTLADCAVDGILPESNLVTPGQASQAAVKWLERLERGEFSCVTRAQLDTELTPIEIKKRKVKFGGFSDLNAKINTEKSETTHKRMTKNPEEWHEYHRLLRKQKENWNIVPDEYWIKKIKGLSDRLFIGDFGCGEAKIAEAIGSRVKSFDHVAIDSNVMVGDMKDVSEYVKDGGLDVAVFCLSLMGKNWEDYLKEATRCLAVKTGFLFITETTRLLSSRLKSLRDIIKQNGFEIVSDKERDLFTFIEARKIK